ncbi:Methyltransf-34 domain containing protein [Pyrenophora tritici-repentis]|uniref:Methyltransf-34 domain containing protein n=2 Tax=Pyrenophora tritici-repentis TaxID=45151 RepID=A0A922T0L0_9PLEO|nr:Methyltransf-34 domain containing protein [Pyrenophora tritici-repentis]KAI1666981.1 Methyltransf-34 domain containing protein [Pyrenophora tritici-repentis]KAI1682827.1 Methyltransf-34 domain containing protein [Pyrenophora tritici-repentis]
MAPNSKLNAKRKAQRESTKQPGKPRAERRPNEDSKAQYIPIELQQLLLNIFRNSFAEHLSSDFAPLLQEVKGHLYNRDFATAFGKNEYLEVYAARWSPSRALGYLDLLWELRDHLEFVSENSGADGEEENGRKSYKVVCLGGGAGAEVVALGGLQKLLSTLDPQEEGDDEKKKKKPRRMEISAVDIADWNVVVENLAQHLTTTPVLSKYASAAAKAANVPFANPEDISITFHQHDVLQASTPAINSQLAEASLVTLLFTLNELYTTSLPLTQKFLLHVTSVLQSGALLLVVDSPGSYSSVTLNGAEKKYPMQWLLDHTLLNQASSNKNERGKEEIASWEKITEDDSRWFRLDDRLQYPIELENMRMQMHLYRKL